MIIDGDIWVFIQGLCVVLVVTALGIGTVIAVLRAFRSSWLDGAEALAGAAVGTAVGYWLAGWPWGAMIGLAAGSVRRATVAGARDGVRALWRRLRGGEWRR